MQTQSVTSGIADSLGMKQAEGAIVDKSQAGRPAEKAGIEAGDVITALNGTPVKDSHALAREIAMLAPSDSVKLQVLHKGKSKIVTLTLGEMPNEHQAKTREEQKKLFTEYGSPQLMHEFYRMPDAARDLAVKPRPFTRQREGETVKITANLRMGSS